MRSVVVLPGLIETRKGERERFRLRHEHDAPPRCTSTATRSGAGKRGRTLRSSRHTWARSRSTLRPTTRAAGSSATTPTTGGGAYVGWQAPSHRLVAEHGLWRRVMASGT